MQQLQHIQFSMPDVPTPVQVRSCYALAGKGFAGIGKSNDDKIRPWFKRNEA